MPLLFAERTAQLKLGTRDGCEKESNNNGILNQDVKPGTLVVGPSRLPLPVSSLSVNRESVKHRQAKVATTSSILTKMAST
jgi:hypothetical protein